MCNNCACSYENYGLLMFYTISVCIIGKTKTTTTKKKQSELAMPQIYTSNAKKDVEFLITCLDFFYFHMMSKH